VRRPRGLRAARVAVGAHDIHYLRPARPTRRRAAVVLVHGLGVASGYFVPLAERLVGRYDVFAPDLPGHGASTRPRHALDVRGLAGALGAWMDAIGLPRATLVGNSLGCQVVTALGRLRPDLVERLVLIGPTVDRERRAGWRQVLRFLASAPFERASLAVILAADYARMGVRRYREEMRHMLHDAIEVRLARLDVPVLVVRGGLDFIVPDRWAREVTQRLRRGRQLTLPLRGHAVHYSAPAATAHAVAEFVG
jgi:pimeloyl-ACP methyl ester carboxylesterase